jgi:hypothetical protein
MPPANGPPDSLALKRAVRRGAAVFAAVGAVVLVFFLLHGFFARKFYSRTGAAQWIWQEHRVASREPVAFYAARNFVLDGDPQWLRVKVAADPEYTLYLNGREIAGGGSGSPFLEEYDVTPFARPGRNRLVASVRSPEGVGGFLLSVDFQPERQNQVVTDRNWSIYRHFDERLLTRDLEGAETPRVIGRPPMGRWNFPPSRRGDPYGPERFIGYPAHSGRVETVVPEVRTISGISVTSQRKVAATLFDFGRPVEGRGRFEIPAPEPRPIGVRYFLNADEVDTAPVRSLVIARGERAVVDPQRRRFRYILLLEEEGVATALGEMPL